MALPPERKGTPKHGSMGLLVQPSPIDFVSSIVDRLQMKSARYRIRMAASMPLTWPIYFAQGRSSAAPSAGLAGMALN